MTAAEIKTEETKLQQALAQLQQQFPNWILSYEFNDSISNPVDVIKDVINEIKSKFPNYKFTINKDSYSCLLILNITPVDKSETFAYFGGNDCGYIVDNNMYRTIHNEFANHSDLTLLDIRVFAYVENSRTMQLEFKQY